MSVIRANSRPSWGLKLIVSIVLATLFAPLIYGAFSALFWEENSEQSERQMVISRIVDSLDGPTLYYQRINSDPIQTAGRCQLITGNLSALSNPPGVFMFGFHHRVQVQQQIEITSKIDEIRSKPLKQLSSIVLGALDACDRSSPLSPICRAMHRANCTGLAKCSGKISSERSIGMQSQDGVHFVIPLIPN